MFKKTTLVVFVGLLCLYLLALLMKRESVSLESEGWRWAGLLIGWGGPQLLGMAVWKGKPQLENLGITALLLMLLSHYQTSFAGMLLLGLITVTVKSVARWKGQVVFNPTAAGLWVASFAGVMTTWWGVSFSPRLPVGQMSVALLITLPLGLFIMSRYKRWPTLVSVLGSFLGVYFLLTGRFQWVTVVEGTWLFSLLVMATEPRTTPQIDKQEWIWAPLLGALMATLFVYRIAGEPYLVSLLVMNLVFVGMRWWQLKRSV